MVQQSQGKIFLSTERGCDETKSFLSMHLFNFGSFFNEHKTPFGNIDVINDDTLMGGGSMHLKIEQSSYVILIPVIGAIRYKDSRGNDNLLAAGQWQLIKMVADEKMEVHNPFKDVLVNFLQVWVRGDERLLLSLPLLSTYDVNSSMNNLVRLSPSHFEGEGLPFKLSIGKFSGRGDTTYTMSEKGAGLFLFVIGGAFEADGRLLHPRDGLALWGTEQVELEALSNDAIVVAIEAQVG
jgi:quercetin 2,3-dioxygenase